MPSVAMNGGNRSLVMIRPLTVPQAEPTAGYYVDGKRFYGQIEPVARSLGIDPEILLRKR